MSIKVQISRGGSSVSYEGSEEFAKSELLPLVDSLSIALDSGSLTADEQPSNSRADGDSAAGRAVGTTGNIAVKLKSETAPDLLMAAAARLVLGEGKETFSRQELHDEAKTAKQYYTENVRKNLSQHLHGLVKENRLNEVRTGVYAITVSELNRIESQLGHN